MPAASAIVPPTAPCQRPSVSCGGNSGTGVAVGAGVGTGVSVGIGVGVSVGAAVAVSVGEGVGAGVPVGEDVGVAVGVDVAVGVGVGVAVGVGVGVGVGVDGRTISVMPSSAEFRHGVRLAATSRRHSCTSASKPSGTFAVKVWRQFAALASRRAPVFGVPMHFKKAAVVALGFTT